MGKDKEVVPPTERSTHIGLAVEKKTKEKYFVEFFTLLDVLIIKLEKSNGILSASSYPWGQAKRFC
ncbi:hypothetical protein A946_05670 [Methylacidiphilum kamchatkense Kam1]|uniref:Uncharacterized protein n=1 Tax=Methylacidiphilum kamchatkense Kam1 TaxID=1202785 RepID=A0A0C1V594_9BACT|nr:hypothetical protein [Methylacidiphilum kamchatkense]KIE58890.1 hypothetical protein A946_05670 [Methylacidiphilum kamchatkense Kam1]QDQ41681.1 hypothetical protein kam1_430 [Methylacidiphilum kamchatkense Kam1]